jgi:hypothetical protein
MRNESLFFILVNNTKDDLEEWKKDPTDPKMAVNEVTIVFKEVFRQHTNKPNLITFFKTDVIKKLWGGFFVRTREYRQWKDTLKCYNENERKKIDKFFKKINLGCGWRPMEM